jgi:hypothetical protein
MERRDLLAGSPTQEEEEEVMRFPHAFRFAVVLAIAVAAAGGARAQCICSNDALVTNVGAGCGAPPIPALNATPPVVGQLMTIYLTSNLPNTLLLLGSSAPPANPLVLPGGCLVYLDVGSLMVQGPYSTNALGAFTFDWLSPSDPALCGLVCNIQVGLIAGGGPNPTAQFSNAIQATMGCAPPGNGNGFPNDAFCTYTPGGFQGGGVPGQIFDNNFLTTFPGGLEIGVYNPVNGNALPNGLRWDATVAGRTALETFLGGGGSSGVIGSDQLNPTTGFGGGNLANHAATLTLNIGFNDAGVNGSNQTGWSGLIYVNPGDSLSGLSITQILGVANDALGGLGLPAGYTFGSLVALLTNLNEASDDCVMSNWASTHLFAPVP